MGIPKVSNAAATSPEVMTTDSRNITLVPPKPGCLCPFIGAGGPQPRLLDPWRMFQAAGRQGHRRLLIYRRPYSIDTPPHPPVVQAMGHRGERPLIARGHVRHGMDHVQRHGDGAIAPREPPAVPDRRLVRGCPLPLTAAS